MNTLKLAFAGAGLLLALSSTASAQLLGERYITVGASHIDIRGIDDDPIGYGVGVNINVLENETLGVDLSASISTAEFDFSGGDYRETIFDLGGTLFFQSSTSFRPFVSVNVGVVRMEEDVAGWGSWSDELFIYSVGAGVEYVFAEKYSVTVGFGISDSEESGDSASVGGGINFNAWLTDSIGVGGGFGYTDSDVDSSSISLRVRIRI